MKPSKTAIEQARQLQYLVDGFIAGKLWGPQDRQDARILVALLNDHSRQAKCGEPLRLDFRSLKQRIADQQREEGI